VSPKRPFLLIAPLLVGLAGCGPALPLSRPAWSPRGDRAAFVRYRPERSDLYLLSPGSGAGPRLLAEGVERFAFSPTGARLYYLKPPAEDGKQGGALMALDLYPPEGEPGRARALLSPGRGSALLNLSVAPGGRIYLHKRKGKKKHLLLEFDPGSGRTRDLTPARGRWHLLSGTATTRAFALVLRRRKEEKDKSLEVLRLELPDGRESTLGSLAGGLKGIVPLHATADGKGIVIAAEEKKQRRQLMVIGSLKGKPAGRAFLLPAGSIPIVAGFTPDAAKLLFSLLVETDAGEPRVESWSLDLATGKASLRNRASGQLVGADAYAAGGRIRLEFTAGGLAAFEGNRPLPTRIWPVDTAERAGAAKLFMAAGGNQSALEYVEAAIEKAGPACDRAALYVLKSEVLTKIGKREEAANAYLESLLRYPVNGVKRTDRQIAGRLSAWSRGLPEHTILNLVARAYKRRVSGDLPAAARTLREAAGFSGDRAWAAGLQFGYAMNLLEAGRGAAAAPVFRKASEAREFPQADWAAGLCVLAYAAGRRDDLAAEEIQRCNDCYAKSPLAPEFKALAADLKSLQRQPGVLENTPVVAGARARLEAWSVALAHLSFAPSPTAEGKQRRLAIAPRKLYRIVLAPGEGPQQVLLDRVAVRLSNLSFSPGGDRLAFLAGEPGKRSLYAIDLQGRPRLGDLKLLLAGRPDPRTRAEDYRWDPKRNLPAALRKEDQD